MNFNTSKLAQVEYMKATNQLVESRTDQQVKRDSSVKFASISTSRLVDINYIYSPDFKQNLYNGHGLGFWKDKHHKYNGEFDNLFIRGWMKIWELQVNSLRASNGTLIIGSAGKVAEDGVTDEGTANTFHLWFDHDDAAKVQPFAVNDVIASKKFWLVNDDTDPSLPGAWIDQTVCTVTAITVGGVTNKITVLMDAAESSVDPYAGQEYVRVGNTTETNRQGIVVLSSDGIDGSASDTAEVPFIDVYDGLTSWADFKNALAGSTSFLKVRVGRLDKITGNLDEYGIWTSNIYLAGANPGANQILVLAYADMIAYDGLHPGELNAGDMCLVSDLDYEIYVWSGSAWVSRRPVANQILYGTETERGAYNTDLLNAGDMWVTTDKENNIWVWSGSAWEDRVDDTIPTDAVGNLILPAVTQSGNGLSMNQSFMGYHVGNVWKTYQDVNGNFYLAGASNSMLQWIYSTATLTIGNDTGTGARMEFVAGNANIQYYDSANVNYMEMGTNLAGTGYSGINLQRYGFIYKYNTYNNAVSTVHSELYNQTVTFVGGISSLVSSTTDGGTPALSTLSIMCGYKALAYGHSNYTAAGIHAEGFGETSNYVYGGYFKGEALGTAGTGPVHGVNANAVSGPNNTSCAGAVFYATGDGHFTFGCQASGDTGSQVYGHYGIARDGTSNTYGGNFNSDSDNGTVYGVYATAAGAGTLWAGYFDGGNVYIKNNLTIDGTVDGIDVAGLKSDYDSSHNYGFSAYASGQTIANGATDTVTLVQVWDDGSCFAPSTFTAPVTGRYLLNVRLTFTSLPTTGYTEIHIVTTARTYKFFVEGDEFAATTNHVTRSFSVIADMSATNTAIIQVYNNTGASIALNGSTTNSHFSGHVL